MPVLMPSLTVNTKVFIIIGRISEKKWIITFLVYLLFSLGWFSDKANGSVIIRTSISASEEYNDNLFFSERNREADFTTTLSPTLSIGYASRNIVLALTYRGESQLHSKNPEADGYFQSMSIDIDLPGLNQRIKGVEIRIIEEMTFSPELPGYSFGGSGDQESLQRPDQRPQNTGQGIQTRRSDTFQNQAGILLSYNWTNRFNTIVKYTNIITRFSDDEFEDRNANQTTFDGVYRHPVSRRTSWTGAYGTDITTGNEREQLIHSIRLGINHRISRLTSINGESGVSFLKNVSTQHTLSAGFSRRLQRGALSLSYTNGIVAGLGLIRSVTRNESVSGSVNQSLGNRVTTTFQTAYVTSKSLSGNEVDTATSTASTGLSIQLLKWLSGNLLYSYLRQDSKGALGVRGAVERNSLTLSFTGTGAPWRILR